MHNNLFPDPSGVFYGENGYLDLLRFVLKNGEKNRSDRTGTGTISYFSPPNIEFDLGDGFPLITTKKVFFRGIIEELLFFLRGDTDTKKLEASGVNIWRGNTTREFLDSRGLADLPDGSLGEGYGWQWRNFGKPLGDSKLPTISQTISSFTHCYFDNSGSTSTAHPTAYVSKKPDAYGEPEITVYTKENDYWNIEISGHAFQKANFVGDVSSNPFVDDKTYPDQIKILIDELRSNKFSRRHVVSAWNPERRHRMALDPCHMMFQMYVTQTNTLHCKMYMRSVDLGCGLPFNIASYAALTHIIAACCDYTPGRLIVDMGDAHIYNDHVDGLTEQISRTPYNPPTLTINTPINSIEDIEKLKFENFVLIGYNSHPSIPLKMSV